MTTFQQQILKEVSPASLESYLRATHFLAAAQIYLKDNVLLREPLQASHFKDRLLGHWGTCPGINLIYAHLNRVILTRNLDIMLVTGPGHGAPANLANLYLEGTLQEFYPELTLNWSGLSNFVRRFSWPGGFPSHLYPGVPGTIHEGGELGYALATAFGAAFDNPALMVACIVGDGESETGPTAAAWQCSKFLDPNESGVVLPILHVNGYKISNPTIFGTMNDEEMIQLFSGYGWKPSIVSGFALSVDLAKAMDQAIDEIFSIKKAAQSGKIRSKPRWPMIILRSPKGWTGVKELDGKPLEGTFRSHQVPVPNPQRNPDHLKLIENWLRSYRPDQLFEQDGSPTSEVLKCCPQGPKRMGLVPHAYGGQIRVPLVLPSWEDDSPATQGERGEVEVSPMKVVAGYLAEVIKRNPRNFRIFSPDELSSNKLSELFEAPTHRDYQWPVSGGNKTEHMGKEGGRVLEILSEHTCQGWLQGYLLTGRHGLFPSYEAFLNIVSSMMDQYAKFLKISSEISWRLPVASLNYLVTSTLWRQEHNGFSHQNPAFINALLNKKETIARIFLPPDANCLLATMDHCLATVDQINLVIANKHLMPLWLSREEARKHCEVGAGIWNWAGSGQGENPDLVLVGIGDVVTLEVIAAAEILKQMIPELRLRIVNVTDLLIFCDPHHYSRGLPDDALFSLFTSDRPVIVNFHGYPSAVQSLLFARGVAGRFRINGYREEGTTTTPFDMLTRNGVSRYDLVRQAAEIVQKVSPETRIQLESLSRHCAEQLLEHRRFIEEKGTDPDYLKRWRVPRVPGK